MKYTSKDLVQYNWACVNKNLYEISKKTKILYFKKYFFNALEKNRREQEPIYLKSELQAHQLELTLRLDWR